MQASKVSDKRLEANRLNAQKSSGPKTEEGKNKSRRNAWKHGLAGAGVVMPDEDRDRLNERIENWTADLRPRNSVEAWLVERAAKASVRLDRCVDKEAAEVAERRRAAAENWERNARGWIEQDAARLAQAPAETVRRLRISGLGCDWLLACWDALARSLSDNHCWTQPEFAQVLNLLGKGIDEPFHKEGPTASLRLNALAARADRDPGEVDAHFGASTARLDREARRQAIDAKLPDHETAHGALAVIVAAEVERLEAARELGRRSRDQPILDDFVRRAAVEFDSDTTLMQRYETTHSLDLHRCLTQLARLQTREATPELESEAPPAPERVAVLETPKAPETVAADEPPPTQAAPVRNEPIASEAHAETNGQATTSDIGFSSANGSNGDPGTAERQARNGSSEPGAARRRPERVTALS